MTTTPFTEKTSKGYQMASDLVPEDTHAIIKKVALELSNYQLKPLYIPMTNLTQQICRFLQLRNNRFWNTTSGNIVTTDHQIATPRYLTK